MNHVVEKHSCKCVVEFGLNFGTWNSRFLFHSFLHSLRMSTKPAIIKREKNLKSLKNREKKKATKHNEEFTIVMSNVNICNNSG